MQLEKTPEGELTLHTMKPFQDNNEHKKEGYSRSKWGRQDEEDNNGIDNDEGNGNVDGGGFHIPAPVECATQ